MGLIWFDEAHTGVCPQVWRGRLLPVAFARYPILVKQIPWVTLRIENQIRGTRLVYGYTTVHPQIAISNMQHSAFHFSLLDGMGYPIFGQPRVKKENTKSGKDVWRHADKADKADETPGG